MDTQHHKQTDFIIRRATLDNALGIAMLLHDLGWSDRIAAEKPNETADRIGRHLALCQADDSHSVYVAETDEAEIVGYISVHWLPYLIHLGPEGFISELFVKSSFRGRRIGSRLLATVEAEAEQRGCARLGLINNRERESYHRQFYKKQGWEERDWAANFVKWLM
ncbi:MAG: GNAT family N-acetyltransferase [Anaerolineae bacterium]|nr:GNAT family N-acetyltransferase [Anaerolineae bacterium]MCB0227008.1 GNAT family N-acetyltransferase [Anaerolineae bacterium]